MERIKFGSISILEVTNQTAEIRTLYQRNTHRGIYIYYQFSMVNQVVFYQLTLSI